MKLSISILALSMSLAILSGCTETVETPNGMIPAQYLDKVNAYTGTYMGQFEQKAGDLNLALEAGTIKVSFTNKASSELLDEKCQSQIGTLQSIEIGKDKNDIEQLYSASFEFDANKCRDEVWGQSLVVYFAPTQLNIKILESEFDTRIGIPGEGGPVGGGRHRTYLSGSFQKL